MNIIDRLKLARKAFNYEYSQDNKLFKAIFSYFNNILYVLPDNFETYITKGYQANPDVYSIIRLIATKASSVPFYVYKVKDKKSLKRMQRKGLNEQFLMKERVLDEVDGTDLNALLERPNEFQGNAQFTEAFVSFLCLTGNAFNYKLIPEMGTLRGKAAKVYPMPSQYVQIIGGGFLEPVKEYKLIIGNQAVTFDNSEIYHARLFNPYYTYSGDELYGQSPLKAALTTMGASNEAVLSKYKAFQNGGVAGLLSSADPNLPMSAEQISQLNELIKEKITGSNNSRNITATNGLVDYKQIGLSPVDLAIIDSLGYDRDTLCRVFGVDPILFATDSATYNNKKEASKKLISDVIVPYLNLLRDFWNDVAKGYGEEYYIDYDLTDLPEMAENFSEVVKALNEAWWVTPNEKRTASSYDKLEDKNLDRIYIPTNLQPIDGIDYYMPIDENNL